MIAEVFTGEADWSDLFLLVAVVLAVVAGVAGVAASGKAAAVATWASALGWFAVAFTAFGLLLL